MWLLLLLLASLSDVAGALYTTLGTWETRCFIEDIPDRTMITYKYKVFMFDDQLDAYHEEPTRDAKLFLTITDLRNTENRGDSVKRIQELKGGRGKIHYFAEEYGELKFCLELHPQTSKEWQMTTGKLHLDVHRQYQDEEDEQVEETQDAIIRTLQKNLRKLKQIKMEQRYYKKRESEFRTISWLTSNRVLWYAVITALTVVSTGCFMMRNLRSFFISKKLV